MKRALLAFLVPMALGTACFLGGNSGSGDTQTDSGAGPDATVLPFTADSPFVYVSKVKNLLTGLPPTQVEVDSVANAGSTVSQQAALLTLIDTWMALPAYTTKMQMFFELAFQQTQIGFADFQYLIPNNGSVGQSAQINLLLQNVRESFARTALALIAAGQPFSDAFTTNTFMMTPPLMELYGFMDQNQIDDAENVHDQFAVQYPKVTVTVQDTNSAITYANTVDPTNANFMNWYFPNLTADMSTEAAPCLVDPRTYTSNPAHAIHFLIYGQLDSKSMGGQFCNIYTGQNANSVFTTADFAESAWKMVTVRTPNPGEPTTLWYDANGLRNTNVLVLNTPRVGFYSTPAFQANWPTNTSNMMRVTMNQSFIVGLGAQVDGTDPTNPGPNPPGLDQEHVSAGAACLGCHQILDPSRSLLQATYSYGYGIQNDAGLAAQKGWFVFNGVVDKNITQISDLGTQLAAHVLYPGAWAQKLCFYANSQACDPTDPEFQRIVADFKSTGQWKTLIEDIFSSPITTNAVATATTTTEGELVSVARLNHLCTLLSARLGLTDPCGLDIVTTQNLTGIPQIAAGLPSDGYGRGAPIPVLPAQPTLFFRAGIENICEIVANELIDSTSPPVGATTYSSKTSASVNAAITSFVSNLMALVPDDPSSAAMNELLQQHYTEVLAVPGSSTTYALRSTFITACESPNVAAIGM